MYYFVFYEAAPVQTSWSAPDFGSVKKNVLPSPGFDSTQILPAFILTIFFAIERPIPVDSVLSEGESV